MNGNPFMGTQGPDETWGLTDSASQDGILIKCESPEYQMPEILLEDPGQFTIDPAAADMSSPQHLVSNPPIGPPESGRSVQDLFSLARTRALAYVEKPDYSKLLECIATNNTLIATAGLHYQNFHEDVYDILGCVDRARSAARQITATRKEAFGLSEPEQDTALFEVAFHRQQCVRVAPRHFTVYSSLPGPTESFCLTLPLADIIDDEYPAGPMQDTLRKQAHALERFCQAQDTLCRESFNLEIPLGDSPALLAAKLALGDMVNLVRETMTLNSERQVSPPPYKLEELSFGYNPDESQDGIDAHVIFTGVPEEVVQRARAATALVNSVQTHTFFLNQQSKFEKWEGSYDAKNPPHPDILYSRAERVMEYAWRQYHTAIHATGACDQPRHTSVVQAPSLTSSLHS